MGWLKRLFSGAREGERGSVMVLGALSLVGVFGMAGLAVEGGSGYAAKVRNQRIADMAVLGGALAYTAASTNQLNVATQTAKDIAIASGMSSADAARMVIATKTVGSTSALQVTVQTTVPVKLASLIASNSPSYTVSNTAVASLGGSASVSTIGACIQALSSTPTYGVTLSGGVSITASGCSVATNAGVTVPWGTKITAQEVDAGKSIDDPAYSNQNNPASAGIQTSPTTHNVKPNQTTPAKDTIGTDALVVAGFAKIGQYSSPLTVSNPVTPAGTDWLFVNSITSYTAMSASNPVKANCAYNDGSKTFTCNGGTYTIGQMQVPGGVTVTFTGNSTMTIANGISNGGNRLTFGTGTYKINGSSNTGSGGVTFGNADVTVGSGGMAIGSGGLIIGNGTVAMNSSLNASGGGIVVTIGSGTHSFAGISLGGGTQVTLGTGDVNIAGMITIGGGSRLTLGAGNYTIGNDGSGNAINLSGGSYLTFGDGQFSANGSIYTSGGSYLTFGATTSHYLNGQLNLNGSSVFGAGAYYINGQFTNNTGGSMTGTNVTFFMQGTLNLSGGTSMNLKAPVDNNSGGGVASLLFATKTTTATKLGGGSQNVYSGMVYAPNSDLNMDGGAGITGGGGCFMLMVSTLTMSGGTTTGTTCSGGVASAASATTSSGPVLLQ